MNGAILLTLPHAFMQYAAMTCGADCRYQRFKRLLPSVLKVERRMVNYAVMAVEQKICSSTAWHHVPKDSNFHPLLSHSVIARSSAFSVHASTHSHACMYTRHTCQ